MNTVLTIVKTYISTTSFLILSALIYLFSSTNAFAKHAVDSVLPINGRILAFVTFLGLIFVYEVCLRYKRTAKESHDEITISISELRITLERGRLISDINAAFTEFQTNGKEFITGEYYIKEIMTLSDLRKKLNVNSYTQNKIEHLVSKIKHV
jgi:cell division protein YceG involved in septum cleavage